MTVSNQDYELEDLEILAETPELRVRILTLGPEQCVPWHHHTRITDTFFCLEGQTVIETREPMAAQRLDPGQRFAVPPGQPHRVSPAQGTRCRFLIVQGVGEYDYVPAESGVG